MQIVVHTKFTLNEFKRLLRTYYATQIVYKIFFIFGILNLIVVFLFIIGIGFVTISNEFPVSQLIVGLLFTFGSRFMSAYIASKAYHGSKMLQEKITYRIDEKRFDVQGESFNSTTEWEKMYKVQELKEWFLVFQSKTTFNPIPKKDFQFGDIENFRDQVKAMSWLKLKLKG